MGVVSRKQTTHIYSEQGTCGCTPLTHLPYLRKSYAQFNILLDSPCCRGKKRPKCENQQFNNQFWPRRARGTYPLFQILMVNLMNLARFKTKINDASLRGSTHQKGTSVQLSHMICRQEGGSTKNLNSYFWGGRGAQNP